MTTSAKTTAAYGDCYKIMDEALRLGGLRVTFVEKKKATVFRHRCYAARKLILSASRPPAGTLPFTPYDDIFIRYESDVKPDGDSRVLVFQLRSKQEIPAITDLDGNPITGEIIPPNFDEFKLE